MKISLGLVILGSMLASTSLLATEKSFYYLRCNSTSFGVDDVSRMVPSPSASHVLMLNHKIDQQYYLRGQGGDSCMLTKTPERNGWGYSQSDYDFKGLPLANGRLFPIGNEVTNGLHEVKISYDKLGEFTACLDLRTKQFWTTLKGNSNSCANRPGQSIVQVPDPVVVIVPIEGHGQGQGHGQVYPIPYDSYFYLRCNATTHQLTQDSYMEYNSDFNVETLRFSVDRPELVGPNNTDTCEVTEVMKRGSWEEGAQSYTLPRQDLEIWQHYTLRPAISPNKTFKVKYEGMGDYRAFYNRQTKDFWINKIKE